jgi:spermidine/putrescine-binding protein
MRKIKNVDNDLSWKLVWDEETKDVLIFKQIKGKFETINKLFEASDKNVVYDKINELGLKYDPSLLEEEWI